MAKRGYDLSPEQALALMLINRFDARTVSSLAQGLGRDRTTITRLLDSLEKKGFVVRSPGSDDRRAIVVSLSDLGRQFEVDMSEEGAVIVDGVIEGISPEDLLTTMKVLIQLRSKAESVAELLKKQRSGSNL